MEGKQSRNSCDIKKFIHCAAFSKCDILKCCDTKNVILIITEKNDKNTVQVLGRW